MFSECSIQWVLYRYCECSIYSTHTWSLVHTHTRLTICTWRILEIIFGNNLLMIICDFGNIFSVEKICSWVPEDFGKNLFMINPTATGPRTTLSVVMIMPQESIETYLVSKETNLVSKETYLVSKETWLVSKDTW